MKYLLLLGLLLTPSISYANTYTFCGSYFYESETLSTEVMCEDLREASEIDTECADNRAKLVEMIDDLIASTSDRVMRRKLRRLKKWQ